MRAVATKARPAAGRGRTRAGASADVVAAEEALERLFRLTVSRSMHTRQAAAVGAVVTRAGYALLRSLDEAGECTMGELARACSMDPGAAARQVKTLEDDGLVARAPSETDGRLSVVTLTDAGRTVYERIVAVRTAHLAEVLAGWSAADRTALAALVARLVDDLRHTPFRPVATTDGRATTKSRTPTRTRKEGA